MSSSIAKSIAIAIKSNKHFRSTISKFDRDENNKHNRKKKQKVISDKQLVHYEDQRLIRLRREIEMYNDDNGNSFEQDYAQLKYDDELYLIHQRRDYAQLNYDDEFNYIYRRREREVNNNDNRTSFKQELASLLHENNQWKIRQRRKREEKTEKMMFNRFIIKRKKRTIDREQQNEVNNNKKKNIEEEKKMIKKKEEEMVISLKIFQEPWMRNELVYSYLTKNADMYNVR